MKRWIATLLMPLLVACGNVPPAPIDHFYRLQPIVLSATAPKPGIGAIAVHTFRADSLYAERPIVYADAANLRQLRQHHYHLWLYPPAQLVQAHFEASLGSVLNFKAEGPAPYSLDGRVLGFERVFSSNNCKAALSLELRLMKADKMLLQKIYFVEKEATEDSLPAFAIAMEQALAKVYADFLGDLNALSPDY